MRDTRRDASLWGWCLLGLLGSGLLPWYALQDGFWGFEWLAGFPREAETSSALWLLAQGQQPWLWPPIACLALTAALQFKPLASTQRQGEALLWLSALGLLAFIAQGFAIGIQGWAFPFLNAAFGELESRQFGMGYGALLVGASLLCLMTQGLAMSGRIAQDRFVASSLGMVIALVALFIVLPVLQLMVAAFQAEDGSAWAALVARLMDSKIWRLSCVSGQGQCGVAWNSLGLAVAVGVLSTLLGLAFALVLTRTGTRFKGLLRSLSLLPVITPPFVIGLSVILLFGLSGVVTQTVAGWLGLEPSRWVYGFTGVLLAQLLAFTPISFMVLIGVVEAISPSMEEASQTLRANAWTTFKTITWPLMRPGLANAFLIGFIESMADFGNPLVLGGNFNVLSTEIFFAIVGSQNDMARAAVLALILLVFTVGAFLMQHLWLGNKRYITISGKGDAGMHPPLPASVHNLAWTLTISWTIFTLVVYAMIVYGSFVELWGRDWSLTLKHYLKGFGLTWGDHGLVWSGSAWNSLKTTLWIATVSAPLTAAIGLITAWLLTRQRFAGQRAFEFGTMLSFAIPGTVIGVSYVVAFNVPPLELTGTAAILVICFVFRNMPVGVRAGIASLSQIDKSLDEASLTLRASSATTFTRITLPLIRPAILSALVYSFVRSMTAISAVIFLVSAQHDMATSYIIGRVENNEYGIAIAYSTVLIVVMLVAIGLFQWLTSGRQIGRRGLRSEATFTPTGAA
jgi:iron(III) transport system permease protein